MKLTLSTVVAGVLLAAAGSANAQLLGLSPLLPDAASGGIVVTYNASTNVFRASGRSQSLNTPPSTSLNNGIFLLEAMISNAGVLIGSSGTLTVTNGAGGATIFTSGNITAFGSGATNRFEFIFAAAAGGIVPVGSQIGTILSGNGLVFSGNVPVFTSNFSNAVTLPGGIQIGSGAADTFLIPSPAAAAAFGLAGLMATRRRR